VARLLDAADGAARPCAMTLHSDAIVIGAGLIGLAIADDLARRGRTVRVLDERASHEAASWAGAGMLAPHPERAWHEAFEQLCLRSFERYPSFVADLIERTGLDPELRTDGVLIAAPSAAAAERLRERVRELRARAVDATWLDVSEARAAEPAFGTHQHGAVLVAAGGQVDNRRLLAALEAACRREGVTIERGASGVRVEIENDRVSAVRTQRARFTASHVVNAAGAWAGRIPGVPAAAAVPVAPVKGQMLALSSALPPIRRVTWLEDWYLVPRPEGRLLVGATSEPAQFDRRVTAGAVHGLLAALLERLPVLADAALVETWAGLRPGTPDGLPYLGPTPVQGYVLACGHYRNGILLAPITASLIAELVDGKRVALDDGFLLDRGVPA
jgi:glycine oxidase